MFKKISIALFIFALVIPSAFSLYESQVGEYDWSIRALGDVIDLKYTNQNSFYFRTSDHVIGYATHGSDHTGKFTVLKWVLTSLSARVVWTKNITNDTIFVQIYQQGNQIHFKLALLNSIIQISSLLTRQTLESISLMCSQECWSIPSFTKSNIIDTFPRQCLNNNSLIFVVSQPKKSSKPKLPSQAGTKSLPISSPEKPYMDLLILKLAWRSTKSI